MAWRAKSPKCFVWKPNGACDVEIMDYHQGVMVMSKKLPNIHPGEIQAEEFLAPLGLSQNALARSLGVPPRRINEIVLGKRAITADTALRRARYLGNSPDFRMALQASFDLDEAQVALGSYLESQTQPRAVRFGSGKQQGSRQKGRRNDSPFQTRSDVGRWQYIGRLASARKPIGPMLLSR